MPDWRKGNPYQSLLGNSLERFKFSVNYKDYPNKNFFHLQKTFNKQNKVDILHLHWIHPYFDHIVWDKKWTFYLKLFYYSLDLVLLRLRGIKIIWTVHNLISHETSNFKNELICRKTLSLLCNKMIAHSHSAKKIISSTYNINPKKITVIPHGNYCNFYHLNSSNMIKAKSQYKIIESDIVVLFIGSVRKYKGIDNLISSFKKTKNPHIKLIVAGKPLEQKDEEWLVKAASSHTNIILDLRFIPDNEIAAIISLANVVIIPFVKTLSSGSVILAMSFKKALILPISAKVLDLPGKNGAIYYNDNNLNELAAILDSLPDYKLSEMGNYNYELAKSLDWDIVAKKLIDNVYN